MDRAHVAAARSRTMARMAHSEIKLADGDLLTVEGTLEEVERKLSDAARSGQSRLAWFTEHSTNDSVGINPAHVASLRLGEISD
jgi:hypothetical protein